MGEKKLIKFRKIQNDKVVKVEIGSGYYNRVQTLLFNHLNTAEPEKAIKALNELKTREPLDKFEYDLLTILTLVYNAEAAFQDAGFTEEEEREIKED